jgi:hypothetical protein
MSSDQRELVSGVRKVWRQLKREGHDLARYTVARLMRGMGLQGAIRGKPVRTTISDKAAPCPLDHVNRQFKAPRPNALWGSDFTYVATWSGFAYVAFIIDAYARRIVGWRVSRTAHTSFVLDALEQALHERGARCIAAASCITATGAARVDSRDRRNTMLEGDAMAGRRRLDRAQRGKLRSPGRPPVAWREDRRRFWTLVAEGRTSEEAAMEIGVSQPVGFRWFRASGGMPPSHLSRSSRRLSGRYLLFAEREEIAVLRAQGLGVREVGRRLGWAASTISRELRRNAATRGGTLDYRATTAQWHAERASLRPKSAKLATNTALRACVQDRLAGAVAAPDGSPVPGPLVLWKGRGAGRRQPRRWGMAWSPQQIAARLRIDHPEDATMRISHEAIYQALYVQSRGALRRELTACLRTGRALRVPRARSGVGEAVHQRRDPDQRAAGRGVGSCGAGPLGGGPDHRPEPLRDRHTGRAHDAVHDVAAPAADGGAWRGVAREERAGARRAWCRGGARRDHANDHRLAGPVAAFVDVGPGCGDGAARQAAG